MAEGKTNLNKNFSLPLQSKRHYKLFVEQSARSRKSSLNFIQGNVDIMRYKLPFHTTALVPNCDNLCMHGTVQNANLKVGFRVGC